MTLTKRSLVKRDGNSALGQAKEALEAFSSGTAATQREIDKKAAAAPPAAPAAQRLTEADYAQLSVRIRINKARLDDAAEEQAQVFLDICERHTLAVSLYDQAKDDLGKCDAELARDKRIDASKAGEKLTEKITDDFICLHPKHVQAQQTLAHAKRDVQKWASLRDAFDQRMRMIRELVGLYAAGYWTNSGTSSARGDVRQSLAERARDEMNQRRQGSSQ